MSLVIPALVTINDVQLLEWIRIVTDELLSIEERFYVSDGVVIDEKENAQEKTPVLEIGEHRIEAITFIDEETDDANGRKPVTDYDVNCLSCQSNARHYFHNLVR